MLASDVNNPAFANPIDPDSGLWVEFFIWERRDPVDSEGKKLTNFEGKPFVRIQNPGDKTLTVEQPVREDHKARFPRQWLAFQASQGEGPVVGTPIEAWAEACPDECSAVDVAELKILKFHTCELLANASDAQVQRLGMGGEGKRVKVKEFLQARHAQQAGGELEALRERDKAREREMQEMREMLAEALSTKPRGPGRPAKSPLKAA